MKTIKLNCFQVADALYDILNSEEFEDNSLISYDEDLNNIIDWIEREAIPRKLMVTVRANNTYPRQKVK